MNPKDFALSPEDIAVVEEFATSNPALIAKFEQRAQAIGTALLEKYPDVLKLIRKDDPDNLAMLSIGGRRDENASPAFHVGIHIVII
jgi:hypothetical protein